MNSCESNYKAVFMIVSNDRVFKANSCLLKLVNYSSCDWADEINIQNIFAFLSQNSENISIQELVDQIITWESHRLELTFSVILGENSVDPLSFLKFQCPSNFIFQVLYGAKVKASTNNFWVQSVYFREVEIIIGYGRELRVSFNLLEVFCMCNHNFLIAEMMQEHSLLSFCFEAEVVSFLDISS